MRKFDTIANRLCEEQAEIFEQSLSCEKLGSELFIRRFIYSDFARRFDDLSIINEVLVPENVISEIGNTQGLKYVGKRYSKETMYWMGYLYRCWCYIFETTSIEVYKTIRPSELAKLYFIYHTLDTEQAIERIREAKSLEKSDDIARGVALYRKILKSQK